MIRREVVRKLRIGAEKEMGKQAHRARESDPSPCELMEFMIVIWSVIREGAAATVMALSWWGCVVLLVTLVWFVANFVRVVNRHRAHSAYTRKEVRKEGG